MLNKESFKKTNLWLEKHNSKKLYGIKQNKNPQIPDKMWRSCDGCKSTVLANEIEENLNVCPNCGYHFRITARKRIEYLIDEDTFEEFDKELVSTNLIDFPGYDKKIISAKEKSNENEAVISGLAKIENFLCVICVMEPEFIMGSMGSIVGEKITRAFEYATKNKLPVIVFSASGGARMHEGILSLMQMAKTSGAVKLHSDQSLLYISYLTNPTTGGVTASYAMQGDINISEPGALIGFAGPRVIEQTIKQKLPEGFQSAEFLLEKGFLDAIVGRNQAKEFLGKVLNIHSKNNR